MDTKVKQENDGDEPSEVFKDVTYFIVGDVSQDVIDLLDGHGAKRDLYLSDIVSHVIADSTKPDEYSEAKELFERPVVTSQWVRLSVKCRKQLPKEIFALEGRLFSGIRVCPYQLEAEDARALWGMVIYHGGQCQLSLDNTVTHLVTTATTGDKYETAVDHDTVKVVTPDWFTDSIRSKELVDEKVYHPRLLVYPKPQSPPKMAVAPSSVVSECSTMTPDERVREAEPMDVSPVPGTVPFMPGHSPGAARRKSSSSDDMYKSNGSRPDTPSAKEALARMVSNRLYASTKSEHPDNPVARSGLSPIMHQGPRPMSPGAQTVPPGMPASMGMPSSGAGHASLGPGLSGQPHTSLGMAHPSMPISQHQAMSSTVGMPGSHAGMTLPVSVPGGHSGPNSGGGGEMPAGGAQGMGMASVPSSMHMPVSGAHMPHHHHPPPPHSQAQFSPGFPHPPHQHPHQLTPQQQQLQHQQQQQQHMQQLQMQQQQQHQQQQHHHQQQQQQLLQQQLQQQHHQLQQQQHQHQMQHQQQQQQLHMKQQQQMQQIQQMQMQQQQQQQLQQQQLQQQQQHPATSQGHGAQQQPPTQTKKRGNKGRGAAAAAAAASSSTASSTPSSQTPHHHPLPHSHPHQHPHPPHPHPLAGMQQQQQQQHDGGREEGGGLRTLRNITNNGLSPTNVARPSPPVKINQMLGMAGQARPPPPAYPFPAHGPGSQQPALPPPPHPPHQHQHHPPPPQIQYFGHESPESIPPDQCLLGCVFYICDYPHTMGSEEVSLWCKIIEQNGGRVSPVYCEAVTHVLCSDQKMDSLKTKAMEEEKRLVTAYWLNDCLLHKKMTPPWQALHIPSMFLGERPCKNQIISITNFNGEERKRVKQMIAAIGAKYTGYMTRTNSVLVCKRPGGMKFEKAKEWRVPVVNVQWLSDLVLGQMDALRLPVQMRYLQVGHAKDFYADLAPVWHWMKGWRRPVRVSKEMLHKASQLPRKTVKTEADTTTHQPPAKKLKLGEEDSPPPSDSSSPCILFTGYCRSVVKRLTAITEKLGGRVTENPQNCTHLVSQKLTRTIKFFHGINIARHLVTKEWLEESSLQNTFLDEEKYQLKDEAGEREVGCNIQESLRKAKTSPIFQGLVFYITPGVVPPAEELKKVIESAGGAVLKRRPAAKTTSKMRDDKGKSTFIVISCPNDLHLCRDLKAQKIDVYSAEMALTGVLRQELDWKMYRLDYHLYAM